MAATNSLGRKEKLKSKKLFGRLFEEGKSLSGFPLKLIFVKTDQPINTVFQVGVTVPKKNFKGAVKRNRIKRLLREAYRRNKPIIFNNTQSGYALLFIYLGHEMPAFHNVERQIKFLLTKFLKAQCLE